MNSIEVAKQYLEIFFSGVKLERLLELFEPNLVFEGPFFKGATAIEYVESLKMNPPIESSYDIITTFENESEVCVIYKLIKPGVSTKVAQKFEFSGGKIASILLIFDTGDFS